MKSIIYYTATIALLTVSCENSCVSATEEFINQSGRDIEILSYRNNSPNVPSGTFSKSILIKNNASINRNYKSCPPSPEPANASSLFEGDSIVINFGDRKLRYGTKILSPRNVFFGSHLNETMSTFTYTLTPEDYANALP